MTTNPWINISQSAPTFEADKLPHGTRVMWVDDKIRAIGTINKLKGSIEWEDGQETLLIDPIVEKYVRVIGAIYLYGITQT